jgi:pimeloyl-ACP methyl ester carboxylesterase
MKLTTVTRGDGPRTAALVHGASESSNAWLRFGDILVEKYDLKLITVDQRGHGASPRATNYHIAEFVDDLVETLPQGLDFLFGQSLGGRTGVLAAPTLRPGHYIGVDPAFSLPLWFAPMTRVMAVVDSLTPRQTRRKRGIARTGEESIERQMANWDAWDRSMMSTLGREGRGLAFRPQPPAVPSTLVLADPTFCVPPKEAARFAALGWDVRTLPKAAHDMHIQDPVGLAGILDDVLVAP